MLDSYKEWHLTVCNNGGCITDIYNINNDTIYNNISYKVLDGYHYISGGFWLREDVNNEKIFMSYEYNNQRRECLLYDFSLEEGDTFEITNPIAPFALFPGDFVVDSIITKLLLDGQNYKFYYLSSLNSSINELPVWIQGIGSLSMINAPGGGPNINTSGQLSCFYSNGNLIYSGLDSIYSCYTNNLLEDFEENDRELYKVYDLLGRTTRYRKNNLLIYMYNDGFIEKKIVFE